MGRLPIASFAISLALATAAPALAHDQPSVPIPPVQWQGYGAYPQVSYPQSYPQVAYPGTPYQPAPYPAAAAPADPHYQEMVDKCRNLRPANGMTGGLIGGAVGGVIGNRVADGNRVLGTVAGAAVGAVAGAVIDKAGDKARIRECDEYFSRYAAPAQAGAYPGYYGYGAYPQPGYGAPQPGYAAPMPGYGYPMYGYTMVPVQSQQQPCVEKTVVTERWVNVPVRRRIVYRRPAVVHDKRVKEKRVYTGY